MEWPGGPHYFDLTGSEGSTAWIRYRVWSADWHTRTLMHLGGPDGSLDRQVGVEMALDGALNGLSSAFDAGVALLIRTAEEALGRAEDARLPVHEYRWSRCRDLLKLPAIADDQVWRVILDSDNALAGERDPRPTGWLARLRRLRNRVAHQDGISRAHSLSAQEPTQESAGGGHRQRHSRAAAPGGSSARRSTRLLIDNRSVDATEVLTAWCDQTHVLTEQMISVAVALGARETVTPSLRLSWKSPQDPTGDRSDATTPSAHSLEGGGAAPGDAATASSGAAVDNKEGAG